MCTSPSSSRSSGGKKEAKKEKAPKKEKAKKEKAAAAAAGPGSQKVEHPLKILDKKSSSANGDEWKRTYKNNPPEVWKQKFWEMFDPKMGRSGSAASSTTTNEKQFMCANAIGGFVQRSDAMRGPSAPCS